MTDLAIDLEIAELDLAQAARGLRRLERIVQGCPGAVSAEDIEDAQYAVDRAALVVKKLRMQMEARDGEQEGHAEPSQG